MYGHWLRPPRAGVDHVHTCTVCWDDVPCETGRLDCVRYLGIVTSVFWCPDCTAAPVAAGQRAGGTSL